MRFNKFNNRVYYIVRVGNLVSIAERGILSFNGCGKARVCHQTFAMQDVQDRRDTKVVPNGRPLHDYVPTYFNPRNATMYSRRDKDYFGELCILVVDAEVCLQLEGVVVSDRNAAADFAKFLKPSELHQLNFDRIYARSWNHGDTLEKSRHKAEMCAELLVPDRIAPEAIKGVVTQSEEMSVRIREMGLSFPTKVIGTKFFG